MTDTLAGPAAGLLRRLDLRAADAAEIRAVLPRAALDVDHAVAAVRGTCDDVRERGDAAVLAAGERFDGCRPASLRVPAEVLAEALERLDLAVRAALLEAARRTRLVHAAAKPADVSVTVVPGGTVVERWTPVRRVGLYVPGGQTAYPSSVVMNVVPAQVAGVASLAVASPPQPDNQGWPHPVVLAACALLGVDEVYAVGGAQAVAMFAHGTESCPAVDLVTGPGNVYVTAAKRICEGIVGIDAEAGPTEIGILADETADPDHVAADLVSQAEHDVLAACLLVSPSAGLLEAVQARLAEQVATTRHRDRVTAALTGQSAVALVRDLEQGIAVVDEWAAEHLEVITADAAGVAARVRNAGAIFVGPWSPVTLGDYLAGSNHVLPTGGTGRHASGLSTHTFLKQTHVVTYDRQALAEAAPAITALAGAEDLFAHAEAVRRRVGP